MVPIFLVGMHGCGKSFLAEGLARAHKKKFISTDALVEKSLSMTLAGETTTDEDDGGIFCQNCSPTVRKMGYFATFLLGLILFVVGIIDVFGGDVAWIIVGSLIILFCPLWVKSPKKCLLDFKDILKATSSLIYIILLIVNILCSAMEWGSALQYILGILLAISGLWYFLSFIPGGQKFCADCIKGCCKSSESS